MHYHSCRPIPCEPRSGLEVKEDRSTKEMAASSNTAVISTQPAPAEAVVLRPNQPATSAVNSSGSLASVSPIPAKSNSEDAVQIDLANRAPKVEESDLERIKVEAERLADTLQTSLNSDTEVKFEVKLYEKGQKSGGYMSSFRFKIVDKETGKVVRQYPPEAIMRSDLQANAPKGTLVETSA